MSFEEAIKSHVTCQGQESTLNVYVVVYGLAVDSLFSERILCHCEQHCVRLFCHDVWVLLPHAQQSKLALLRRPPPPHYFQGAESGTNPSTTAPAGEFGPTVTAENTQQNSMQL